MNKNTQSKKLVSKSFSTKLHNQSKLIAQLPNKIKRYPDIWLRVYYKEYPRFPKILLPTEKKIKEVGLFSTLMERRSIRKFKSNGIDFMTLSKLLYFSAGIKDLDKKDCVHKRTYPSGGARYPLELYTIVLKGSEELPLGIYHYNVKLHALHLLQKGKFTALFKKTKISYGNTELISNSAILLIITGVFGRTEIKYGKRSYRLVLFEAGHMAQNIYLVSTALKLGCCAVGGFEDEKINSLLRLDEDKEQALYMLALGTA